VSEDADDSSKTEEPTGKRLQEAHDKGQFAISREIHNWLMLVVTLVSLVSWAPGTLTWLSHRMAGYFEHAHEYPTDAGGLGIVLTQVLVDIGLTVMVPVLLLMVVGILASLLQTGWHVSWEAVKPSLETLNPISNFAKLFSKNQLMELGKGIIKIAIVGAVAYYALIPMLGHVELYAGLAVPSVVEEMSRLAYRLVAGVLGIMTVIAALDFLWQRFDFMQKMRMTKQEVKEEYKQSEGDPVVKGRLRQIRMEKARQRMMANVPKADVVITNPTHFAVAMKYDPAAMGAPMVVAKGADNIALNIRKLAEEHDVPIVSNPPLARALYAAVEIDQEIPAEHYRAVAEIITYVFKLKNRSLKH